MNFENIESIKHTTKLGIYRGKEFVGWLNRTDQGCKLEFAKVFLENKKFDKLSYCIPKTNKTYSGVNLPAFFAGLLPEGLRLKALVQNLKTSEDDLFTLLAATGKKTIGDIYTETSHVANSKQKVIDLKNTDFYELFENSFTSFGDDAISGVQEKISSSMISFPVGVAKKDKLYILKLNPKDKPNLIFNEQQCLTLAEKCGFKVNKSKIVYDKNNNPGLLIERFDRKINNDEIQMIHQEDACQFLDRYPADKYRLSFNDICSRVNELATAPKIEILKLIQLYLFSYFIGNGDLHAKNISLQTEPGTNRVKATPAYDLICTYLYKDLSMALKLDGRDKNFKRKHFIDFAKRFLINEAAMNQAIDKIKEQIIKHKNILYEIPNLSDKERGLIDQMLQERLFD